MIFVHKRKHKRSQFHKLYIRVSLHAFCSDVSGEAFNIEILYMLIVNWRSAFPVSFLGTEMKVDLYEKWQGGDIYSKLDWLYHFNLTAHSHQTQ